MFVGVARFVSRFYSIGHALMNQMAFALKYIASSFQMAIVVSDTMGGIQYFFGGNH